MFRADYHTHSSFSFDSDAPMENMIIQAIAKGLNEIAFTDHVDFDKRYTLNDYDEIIPVVMDFREKYKDRIKIVFGVEIGLENKWKDIINPFSKKYPFDFIIGSSHATKTYDLYYDQKEFFSNRTKEEAYSIYFEEIYKNVLACPNFNVYGHLDFVSRYGLYEDNSLKYEDYSDLIDKVLKAIIENGKGIEINTSGFRYGIDNTYPSLDIIRRYKELGGEILTCGSDSHSIAGVGGYIDYAYELAKACGFKYITRFENQKPDFVLI
ncbi:MAG: histidinol-phosphatase HisJ family protein [Lachnospirales bacterium]